MSSTNSQIIEKLNRNNYSTWKIMIKMILIDKELWSIVNEEKIRPSDNMTLTEQFNWKTQVNKVIVIIILSISKSELVYINNITDPIEIWKKLQTIYKSKETTS